MTAVNNHFVDYVVEQLAPLRSVASSRFFGGTGLSSDGTQFAMIMSSVLYFVVNDITRPKYEKMGSSSFSYRTQKRQVQVRKYYTVPAHVIEDQDELLMLARESIYAASTANRPVAKVRTKR